MVLASESCSGTPESRISSMTGPRLDVSTRWSITRVVTPSFSTVNTRFGPIGTRLLEPCGTLIVRGGIGGGTAGRLFCAGLGGAAGVVFRVTERVSGPGDVGVTFRVEARASGFGAMSVSAGSSNGFALTVSDFSGTCGR